MKFSELIITNGLGEIAYNQSFKELTTIGCGGNIKEVYYPKDIESLQRAFAFIKKNNLRYFIIGNGSNTLALDNDFDGIVIALKKLDYSYNQIEDKIVVSAFYPTISLAYDLSKKGLGDLSFLGGIPGLLGGAIYNNSGAYNDDISNHIISVKYIDTSGEIKVILKDDCAFGYRKSIFHYIEGIIIEAELKISNIETSDKLAKRKKNRMLSQPLECKSMGSIFKNNPLIESWRVIDALHLRGFRIGDAAISMKHTNFIINLSNAKASDVMSLIELIENRSRLEFGIILSSEITIIKN